MNGPAHATAARPAARIVRVVKVGGSLLDWPPLPTVLRQWLDEQPAAVNVAIAGGGALADAIRRADAIFKLGEAPAHGLCIELLGVSARLLATILREDQLLVSSFDRLRERCRDWRPKLIVFDPRPWLCHEEAACAGTPLPHDWTVTTDSITARVAAVLAAEELVLLKSQDAPAGASLSDLASGGYVDQFFPTAAGEFQGNVRFVNLRTRH